MADQNDRRARRLLITGATGGMGRATALLAAREGYDLVLADLSLQNLKKLAAECSGHGVTAQCQTLDVARADSVEALVALLATLGGVDSIIHTVGLSPQMADWARILDVDLVGTVGLLEQARACLNKGGAAVVIASMSAYMVPPHAEIDKVLADPLAPDFFDQLNRLKAAGHSLENSGMAYAYAKKALKQYVADRAPAWGKEGKRFTSISPGLIDTAMGRLENAAMEDFEKMQSLVALEHLGAPEDIANAALFLISDKASYITGCDILVDGGFVASLGAQQRQNA